MVENPGPDAAAGIYLRFSLYASVSFDPSAVQEAALPVTVLPAGARTAAAAFFPPDQAQADIPRVELLSAVRSAEPAALLPLSILKEDENKLANGMELAVEFRIDSVEAAADRLDAVLVLLDAAGRPIGCRIYHLEGNWPAGQTQSLTLKAFVLAGELDSYEFILQARSV